MELLPKQIAEIVAYWRGTAVHDFDIAKKLWNVKSYDAALFFCHLTIEKLLKANIVQTTKWHAPYTHDLLRLAKKTSLNLKITDQEHLKVMTGFNMSARDYS